MFPLVPKKKLTHPMCLSKVIVLGDWRVPTGNPFNIGLPTTSEERGMYRRGFIVSLIKAYRLVSVAMCRGSGIGDWVFTRWHRATVYLLFATLLIAHLLLDDTLKTKSLASRLPSGHIGYQSRGVIVDHDSASTRVELVGLFCKIDGFMDSWIHAFPIIQEPN